MPKIHEEGISLRQIVTEFETTYLRLQQKFHHVMTLDELLQLREYNMSRQALYDSEVETSERTVGFLHTLCSYTYLCMERSDLIDSSKIHRSIEQT